MVQNNLHLIIGLGVTGKSCVTYLASCGIPIAVNDTRINPPNAAWLNECYPAVPLRVGGLDQELLAAAHTIVVSPGFDSQHPDLLAQKAQGKAVIGDVELFARAFAGRVVAITGSNGKSTVTTLVGLILEKAGKPYVLGGNLGTPILDLLINEPDLAQKIVVLELSSFQLDTLASLQPYIATVLNVTADHMDRYASFAHYVASKQSIYHNCQIALCNRDDAATECSNQLLQRKFYFTLEQPVQNEFGIITHNGIKYLAFEKNMLMPIADLTIREAFYYKNALAALAIGYSLDVPMATMLQVVRDFTGLDYRCQFLCDRRGVAWYNDSKGTNVGAATAAIGGIGAEIRGKVVLIAGGVGKDADFAVLRPLVKKYVRTAILLGEAKYLLADALRDACEIIFVKDMPEAVQCADQHSHWGDCVLLSPACASYDMFRDFTHRGEVFTNLVQALPA